MQEQAVVSKAVTVAGGVYAPGHLGELTQIVDFDLVDAVLVETRAVQRRLRLLPSRVVVYFVLTLALFGDCSYRPTWGKLTAALMDLRLPQPNMSSLARARRRVGAAPLRRLFETLARTCRSAWPAGGVLPRAAHVAVDGTTLHVPDQPQITHRYPKRSGDYREFGYPLLRLLVIVECGTRALLAAGFGPDNEGELGLASRVLGSLDATMLVLADAGFDAATFLDQVTRTGARFLVRGDADRRPTITQRLPDGSYLARIGYRILPTLLPVRIVEATVTVTLADGTERTEPCRLITNLVDHTRYPARELVHLYHERWQAETAYASIKHTILDGRVLRSRSTDGLEQEIWAVLTTYQALIRAAAVAIHTRPGLEMDRISFTVLASAAADTITTATAVISNGPVNLLGCIGQAILRHLLPARKGRRTKPRTRKSRNSKYAVRTGPHLTQTYTIHTAITIFENGLVARPRRR